MSLLDGFNLDRVLPTLHDLPMPGADFVTPEGIRVNIESVCSIERGRCVATGRPLLKHKHRYEPAVHCFMFFWENQNGTA